MGQSYALNKQHIYKWRQTHKEKYAQINRDAQRRRRAKIYEWRKISEQFLSNFNLHDEEHGDQMEVEV